MKGIYSLKINHKAYIGKDIQIHKKRRLRQQLNLLNRNSHYNRHLQYAFNKYGGKYEYNIVYQSEIIIDVELLGMEKHYINLFNSFHNGYNLTKGGEGMSGYKFSDKVIKKVRVFFRQKESLSKLTNKQFFEIADLLISGYTNGEIAIKYNLHPRYVSLIRHKKRFKRLWEQVDNYQPVKSRARYKKGKINEAIFKELVRLIRAGETNASIEIKYNLAGGCVSRIRHKKNYRLWWNEFFNEN